MTTSSIAPMSGRLLSLVGAVLLAACSQAGTDLVVPPDTTKPDTTITKKPAAVTIAVAGNIASCGVYGDDATAALLDTMPGTTIFTAGDNAFPSGTATTYQNCYGPTWGRFLSRTWVVLGNHDYDSSAAAAAFDYFGDRVGARGRGYYSMNLGEWHIIVLNDNENPADSTYGVAFTQNSAQEQWLRADLAANPKLCTMALWHQPLFMSSTNGFTSGTIRKILWDDLFAAGADVVVNGHVHQYERMAPMDPSGVRDDAHGIRQFNNGLGGASSQRPTTIHPNSEKIGADFGVLKFTLRADSYDWQFIPVAGATFTDSGTGTCH